MIEIASSNNVKFQTSIDTAKDTSPQLKLIQHEEVSESPPIISATASSTSLKEQLDDLEDWLDDILK